MRAALAILALTLATTNLALGAGNNTPSPAKDVSQQQFLPVEEAFQLDIEPLDNGELKLYWTIAEAYYLYQHRFKFILEDDDGTVELAVRLPDAGLCFPPRKQYFTLDFSNGVVTPIEAPAGRGKPAKAVAGQMAADLSSLPYMLLLAFLGGAILNLMPCVFPILSLKVLSFANGTDHDRHLHSWVYTVGVVLSFVLVAAVLIVLQQAGRAVGWGFQLQSPGFVIALAYLFVAMGLSLSGLIEFGSNLMNLGSGLANRGGTSGSFFTGVLAVVVASPCTAPLMGTALGFAVSQPPLVGLLVFAALGAGMAAPLLLFSYSGAARALMPKPGPWMEKLKQFLAFPLYATAVWLLWVAGRQTGVDTMALALAGAVMLALGLWLFGQQGWRRGVALACLALAVGLGSMRGPDVNMGVDSSVSDKVAWSDHGVETLRSEGKPVFVDVTADWCITCKANQATVLSTNALTEAFNNSGVVYMTADWTNYDPDIAKLLERHGRTGIPLYLMYPADTDAEPLILPQLLTRGVVLDAISAVSNHTALVSAN